MKTALYVADVARTYRQAIDDYFDSPSCMRLIWITIGMRSLSVRIVSLRQDFSMDRQRMNHRYMTTIRMLKSIRIWGWQAVQMSRDL